MKHAQVTISKPSFLYRVVKKLAESKIPHQEKQYWIVPTRRAGVFLREALSTYYQSTIWAPRIFSIQDFIRYLAEWQFPEPLPLIFELYRVYDKHLRKGGYEESFEQFYNWGEMLLRDFDEVDKYMVDAAQLFRNIKDLKEIEMQFNLPEESISSIKRFWQTIYADEHKTLSSVQQEFLYIWEKLHTIYQEYRSTLLEKGIAYDGMAYRWVSEKLTSGKLSVDASKIVFIGFNALSHSEEKIVEYLLKHDQAMIFWDVDKAYFQTSQDESLLINSLPGKFIQEYHHKWKDLESYLIIEDMTSDDKYISIEGVALPSGQAHYLGNILQNEHLSGDQLRNHAVILADETLLFPVLNKLPPSIDRLNITMGYPLRQTPVYHLLVSLAQLIRNMRIQNGNQTFHVRDVLAVLGNAYVQNLSPGLTQAIRKDIIHKNMLQIPATYLQEQLEQGILKLLFTPPQKPAEAISYFLEVFDLLIQNSQNRNAYLEAEYIFQLYRQFNQFRDILSQYDTKLTFYGFGRLFREIMSKARIPFEGEPLSGLQIMGFLETRVLDFEHIYILGSNEGNLPDTSTSNSYIPYVLRRGFGLPTYEEKDTIYAYHFFRLLQRSKHIHLIYNTIIKDKGGAGEISRFLQQIRYYFRDVPNIHLVEKLVNTPLTYHNPRSISIPNDQHVKGILERKFLSSHNAPASHYLSATALTTYMACPLRFYFKYIANVREPEKLEEYMEARTFGKVLHEALEHIYSDIDHIADSSTVQQLQPELESALKQAFSDNDLEWNSVQGMNYLFKEALKELAQAILNHDAEYAPFKITFLEEEAFFETQVNLEGKSIRLNGMFDRVDFLPQQHTVCVLDYKTGQADIKPNIPIEKLFAGDKFKEMFQGYFYSWLYKRRFPDEEVTMAFYPLREIQQGRKYINGGRPVDVQVLAEFEQYLFELLKRLFSEPFDQVEDEQVCKYCAYKEICNRG